MLPKRCQRHHSFLQPLRFIDTMKESTSGTLSSDTITTTSSGYSTGGSSVLTTIMPPLKKPSCLIVHNQHKTKSKGFHNLLTRLKSFISSPKTKFIHSTTSKEMSSTKILRQYSTSYDLPSSFKTTNNTISLPFTYYHNSSIKSECNNYVTKSTNFEKISAWLDHTELMTREEQDDNDLLYIDEIQQQSTSPSPIEINHQIIMKKTSSNIRTPKRSTSMVATMTRPIIEQKQYERTVSPTLSFSSSILARGMSERITPSKIYHQSRTNLTEEQTNILLPKSNRRRAIDFSRRRTVAGPTEQINNNNNNKENLPINRRQPTYRFSPSTSNNIVTKKYYFHSNPSVKNEDILMNSYGLKLHQQQQQQQPIQQRQSISTVVMIPQISENSSKHSPQKQLNHRPSIHSTQQEYTSDSLDDLLCDREVESYFYPNKQQSPTSLPQHIYINLETPHNYYQPLSSIHSTLC